MKLISRCLVASFLTFTISDSLMAGNGTSGANFLNIPVGAEPASLGSAYSAMATNAYAPVWNPSGLGRLDSIQFGAQHLSYLESIHYEFASFALPLRPGTALGASIQYLGTGDMTSRDPSGVDTGEFSSHYAAYSLAAGHAVTSKLSLGLTGKWIQAKLDDVSAGAYAFDVGSLYQANERLDLALVIANVGNKLKFLSDGDSLPMAVRFGGAVHLPKRVNLMAECALYKEGPAGGHFGAEWSPIPMLALRTGYQTETTKELGAGVGFSTGLGLRLWGQELAYAWKPTGDLGDSHYFSLLARLGASADTNRNLTRLMDIQKHRTASSLSSDPADLQDEQQLLQLLRLSEAK